jgi:hypothetical protein
MVGTGAQKLKVLDIHRVLAFHLADDTRHWIGVAGAVERCARIVDVHSVERGGEAASFLRSMSHSGWA